MRPRVRSGSAARAGLLIGLAALAIPATLVARREHGMSHENGGMESGMHHGGGVPVAIVVDRPAAGYRVSLWADPIVGTSTVYAVVRAANDSVSFRAPSRVRFAIASAAGGERPIVLDTHDQASHGGRTYMANMTLPRAERWNIRVLIDAADVMGDVSAQVAATPPLGHGLPGLLLASVPFFVVTGLFVRRGVVRRAAVHREARRLGSDERGSDERGSDERGSERPGAVGVG